MTIPNEHILKLTYSMPDAKKDKACTEFATTMINYRTI